MNTLKEIISEQFRYRKQIFKLAKSDLINTYSGTLMGWTWAIIRPATYIAIYYFAFAFGLRTGRPVEGYSYFLWLITGIIPWFYIRDVFVEGAASIRKYRYLVTKIKFPLSVIPTIESTTLMMTNLVIIAVMLVIYIFSGHYPDIYWLQIPLYLFFMFVFFLSWSLFAAILSSLSKDFLQLIKSVTIGLFWLSGIFFDPNRVENQIMRGVLKLNPITFIVNGFRNSLIYKKWIWEDMRALFIFVLMYVIMTMLAIFVYKKLKSDVPDVL